MTGSLISVVGFLRSDIEFCKRVFLDRLTVGAPSTANIDGGPGAPYSYGAYYDATDFGVGADCSGAASIIIDAAINGPAGMSWSHLFDTQSFPAPFGQWFRQTTQADLLDGHYPIKVAIHRAGGGASDHMNVSVDGWLMESNSTAGTCTTGSGALAQSDSYWNTFFVSDAPIVESTAERQAASYPRGLDYAGGRLAGAQLRAAGITFVCRYLTDGGSVNPGKLLLPAEFADLTNSGVGVVFNYETTATFMLTNDGANVARAGLNYIHTLPGAPTDPVIYFSCDFDEAPTQQGTINAFCQAAQTVLPGRVGLYGPYYCLQRAKDAGVVNFLWQTEAWSGFGPGEQPHIDSRVNIVQRNQVGYQVLGGVQCDVNEAHTDDIGAWLPHPVPVPPPVPAPFQYPSDHDMVVQIWEQLFGPQAQGWPGLFGKTTDGSRGKYLVEAVADMHTYLISPKGP